MGIKTFFCAYFNRTTAFKVLYCLTSIECEAHTYMRYANTCISDIHTSHLSTQDMFQPITRSHQLHGITGRLLLYTRKQTVGSY